MNCIKFYNFFYFHYPPTLWHLIYRITPSVVHFSTDLELKAGDNGQMKIQKLHPRFKYIFFLRGVFLNSRKEAN